MSGWTILLACVCMTVKDLLATTLTVAESRGNAVLAGAMDASGDLAQIAVTVLGAGEVIEHGLSTYSVVLIAALVFTSFWGTLVYTWAADRLLRSEESRGTESRLLALERAVFGVR